MFSNKTEVDRHVENALKKINSEAERNLRCFTFAKLYFAVGDYEQARRYVSSYLSVKPNSAEAHRLLGKSLEKLDRKQAALEAYRTSLQLDPKQNHLVIKVCELLADNVNLDQSGAKYFCELAQKIDPRNPIVYSLKERIITSENDDPKMVSNLLLKELESRPTDVYLRVRLLKHFLQCNMVKEAYKHAIDIETRDLSIFSSNLSWYETVGEILTNYQRNAPLNETLNWEYWFLSVSVADKLVGLTLDERSENMKNTSEYIGNVFNFDQSLHKAVQNLQSCPDRQLVQEFLNHYRAQLCFHLATLMLKQAKKDFMQFKEVSNLVLPLLLIAYHTQPSDLSGMWINHMAESRRRLVQKWHKEASFRCSQTGHVLVGMAKDRKSTVLEKAHQYSTGMWKEQFFKKLFITRDQQLKMSTSYFVNSQDVGEITIRLPDQNDLLKYDQVAQLVFPDSLHHYIWIYLNNNLASIKLTTFEGLQYSVKNLKNCGAETLNILDLQAFIYCATICAQANLNDVKMQYYSGTDKPNIFPVSITQHLGTVNQYKFFVSAYKMYKNEYDHDMGELRLILIKGIEVVRCLDHHGLDVDLLITLAKTFSERAKNLTKQSEIEANEARAELYWKAALPLLEKLRNNQVISYPSNRLFNCKSKDMSLLEICGHIESGKLFNAQQLMKKKEFERALHIFEILKDPYASFYQAQIYKQMADQQLNQNKENVTSEMRSQHIILLSKARDCLYLTLDRLREPSVDSKHPLNSQLGSEIEKIERLLSRIDPDCANRNECDGMSDDNVSSVDSDHYITGYTVSSFLNGPSFPVTPRIHHPSINNQSTPRYDFSRREARPSPERLDAQLRQMSASKDAAISHILEQNKVMLDSHRHLVDELRCFKDAVNNLTTTVDELKGVKHSFEELKSIKKSVDELKASVDELENFKTVTDLVYEMKKEITELKKDVKTNQLSDEDIYGLTTDYGTDYNVNANLNMFNSNSYANYQGRMMGNASYLPPIYPGMYPPMAAYYGGLVPPPPPPTGALPFGTEQDFRAISAALSSANYGQAALGLPPQTVPPPIATNAGLFAGQSLSQTTPFTKANQFATPATTTTTKAAPVNVVITCSDPLPLIKNTQSQPVLSVTIPPQHLKGGPAAVKPHNYQIPLPASNVANATQPTILNKPILPVSTQSLLSNVAPPVYSAVADSKTPQKNVSLGLHIDKSLDQTFSPARNDGSNLSARSVDEEDACPDFKPIIPLPDEVPVTTGEENEIVLFSERAKLYRFQDVWKERGVGTLKLLKNPQTGKVRLLMRRDQVHKICANHFITKDMNLIASANNDKAYVWAAQDYADEEIVLEKFCVRFKTTDDVKRFYDAFENAKKNLPDSNEKLKESTPVTTTQSNVSLGGFVFSSTPNFKQVSAPTTTAQVTITPVKSSSPFAAFTFSKPLETKAKEDTKESKVHQLSTAEDEEDFVPTIEFKPVVPLPDIVEVKTGEENCEILFESRAKLLRWDTTGEKNDWKERGIGVIKILKDTTVRLVMRREQVHKVCCNHQLLKTMDFKFLTNNAKALTWCAKDFSEGVLKPETFAIRFKTEELAKSFYNTIQTAQDSLNENNFVSDKHVDKHMKPDTKPVTGFGDKFKPAKGSWECKNCYISNDGKLNHCMACETPKNDTVPVKSSNVSGTNFAFGVAQKADWGNAFKPKKGTWECQICYVQNDPDRLYCVSCETPKNDTIPKKETEKGVNLDTGGLKFSFGVPASKSVAPEQKPSWGDTFKPKQGSWECNVCYIHNDSDKLYCVSCENPKDDAVPKKEPSKGISLDTGGRTFTFGMPATSVLGQKSTQFSFAGVKPESDKQETPDKFVFGSPQKHDFEFTPKSPLRNSIGQKDDDSDNSNIEEEEECDNIYFKPIIPLPDKVDVKTGEEEEEVLYCHRAKLFRFSGGQWKERGIGDLKMLKRKDNGKLRIVMRREQVLKICLNHTLTSDIEYKPKDDDKTWLFYAPDFSEGEISHDQFCLRFKNAQVAQEFKKAVNDALNGACSSIDTEKRDSETDDDDVIIVSETKVTPEEEREAIRLGLPPKFFSYRQLPDCNCEQCKKDDEYLRDLLQNETSLNITSQKVLSPITPLEVSQNSSVFVTPSSFNFSTPPTKCDSLKDLLSKPSLLAEAKVDSSKLFQSSSPFPASNAFSTPPTSSSFTTAGNLFAPKINIFNAPKTETTSTFTFSLPQPATSTTASNSNVTSTTNVFANLKNSGSIFGSSPSPPITAPTSTTNFAAGSNTSIFEGVSGTATTTSIFGGGTTSTTPTTISTIFAPSTANPVFGANSTTSTTGNIFPNSTANPVFGSWKNTSIFGNSTSTTSTGSSNIFGGSTVFGQNKENNPITPFDGTKAVVENATTTNLKEDDELVLNCNSGLTFASLAANVAGEEAPAFAISKQSNETNTPFAFLGAGAPVFGSKKENKESKDEEDEESGTGNAEEEYDPHYEPIIPLPEAIVVSTGEEDETPVFNERAKLFRYDAQTKQWKERGVGQMKILHHPINNTYRFLLRREQVHKVVLNQLIIPDLDLQPMTTSDKAWMWAGYNYTDDESALEKLAIRFKNCELAQKFSSVVQDVTAKVKEIQTSKMIPASVQNIGKEDNEKVTQVVQDENNDEEEEDEEDDERSVMFTKRCTLSEQTTANQWQTIAMGELQVFYDPELYATRIWVTDDSGLLVSNTIIGINTVMNIDKNSCMWDAVEWSDGDFRWRTLKATFSSEVAAQEFHYNYLEGLNYAQELDIIDEIPDENEYVEEEEEETET